MSVKVVIPVLVFAIVVVSDLNSCEANKQTEIVMKALAHLKTNLISQDAVDYRGTYPMLRIEKSRQF
jgi:hypothetical protein